MSDRRGPGVLFYPHLQHAQCQCFYARRQPVSLRSDFFAPKYPVLNSGTIVEFLLKNETIVIIYYYAIYFP